MEQLNVSMKLYGNEILYSRKLFSEKESLLSKIKRRKKQNKHLKKQQKQKKIKKGKKRSQKERDIYRKCGNYYLGDKFYDKITYLGGDFQSYGKKNKNKTLFKGRNKCFLVSSYLDWGSWGSLSIDYFLHKPSGWILSVHTRDTRDSLCDNRDIYEDIEWNRYIEVSNSKLYFI